MVMRVTRLGMAGALVLAGVALAGCERGDARLESLSAGMARDSVLTVMGDSPQRVDPYLVSGQYIEAMYFPRPGRAEGEGLEDRNMSPVVVVNGRLAGWGWTWWDSAAAANSIPVAPKR
jgi:hypothetical protein